MVRRYRPPLLHHYGPNLGDDVDQQTGSSETNEESGTRLFGLALVGAAAAVFIACSLIQSACGSSMFSTSYADPGPLKAFILNVTFYPGWLLTAGLAIAGLSQIFL